MKRKFDATITFTVDDQHPDYDAMDKDKRTGVMTFTDRYTFDCYERFYNPAGYWDFEDVEGMEEEAREDMLLVAGGGYDWKHVHNVKFSFEEYRPEKEFLAKRTEDDPYQTMTINGHEFDWDFEIRDWMGNFIVGFEGVDSMMDFMQKEYDLCDEAVDPETGEEYDPENQLIAMPTMDGERIEIPTGDPYDPEYVEEPFSWVA